MVLPRRCVFSPRWAGFFVAVLAPAAAAAAGAHVAQNGEFVSCPAPATPSAAPPLPKGAGLEGIRKMETQYDDMNSSTYE